MNNKLNIIVLVSGQGTNLQAIINAIDAGHLNARVVAIISNRCSAQALQRARQYEIPAYVVPSKNYPDREQYDAELAALISRIQHDLIVLAGFMRIFSDSFVNRFHEKIINIHPSLLPRHRGLETHKRALRAGDKLHGTSIHFVTPELDGGPVIAQSQTLIDPEDDIQSLSARVQQLEHKLYPLVLDWFAAGRISLKNGKVQFDGTELTKPLLIQ